LEHYRQGSIRSTRREEHLINFPGGAVFWPQLGECVHHCEARLQGSEILI
jgi:hypothetical protein